MSKVKEKKKEQFREEGDVFIVPNEWGRRQREILGEARFHANAYTKEASGISDGVKRVIGNDALTVQTEDGEVVFSITTATSGVKYDLDALTKVLTKAGHDLSEFELPRAVSRRLNTVGYVKPVEIPAQVSKAG